MFKDNYQHAMDGIKPSDSAVANTLEMINDENKPKRRLPKNTVRIAIASCLALIICLTSVFAVFKFANDDNGGYGDHTLSGIRRAESYDDVNAVIKNIYSVNIFDAIFIATRKDTLGEAVQEDALVKPGTSVTTNSSSTDSKDYSDTNNQIQGVQEADIVKTDGNYIYSLSVQEKELRIVKIEGNEMQLTSSLSIGSESVNEMLLTGDKLCIIGTNSSKKQYTQTVCHYYDISDKSAPKLSVTLTQDGWYNSSRSIGNKIYVITTFQKLETNYLNAKSTVIPTVNGAEIPAEDIWLPDEAASASFTILTSYDTVSGDGNFSDAISVLGVSNNIFSAKENLYLTATRSASESDEMINGGYSSVNTCIFRIPLTEDNIDVNGSACIPGNVLNQFSMNENDGCLSVATNIQITNKSADGKSVSFSGQQVNRVYCLDKDMNVSGVSADMGINESIKSVRYIGNIAYVVTFRQTDPLYAVDLNNRTNPTVLSELKIDGFSTYMQQFTESLLFGIGYDADSQSGMTTGLKLTMFDITDNKSITDIDSYVIKWGGATSAYTEATYNHKAVLISGKKNIIGIPMTVSGSSIEMENGAASLDYKTVFCYTFFEFTDNKIIEKKTVNIGTDREFYGEIRGLYIEDNAYVVSDHGIICLSLESMTVLSRLEF